MIPYYQDDHVTLHHGNCLDVLRSMPDESVHAVVTDPPYGLSNTAPEQVAAVLAEWVAGAPEAVPAKRGGFMGNDWDSFVPPPAVWIECYRVLKPGGHMAVFAGARTQDLMGLSIRLAGFEVRDTLGWVYGSGFPKSMDVAKAVAATQAGFGGNSGAIRRATMGDAYTESGRRGNRDGAGRRDTGLNDHDLDMTPDAERWDGWGTALKPAIEPIILARKPLSGTVAQTVLDHSAGVLNIDACRVGMSEADRDSINAKHAGMDPETYQRKPGSSLNLSVNPMDLTPAQAHSAGRFPANVLLDEHAAAELDEQSGVTSSTYRRGNRPAKSKDILGEFAGQSDAVKEYTDLGGASRFFPTFRYQAKAPASERPVITGEDGKVQHPTVKPLALMRWLITLISPPGATVLDPFAGSGTTLEAAMQRGVTAVGIEMTDDYLPLIMQRIERQHAAGNPILPPHDTEPVKKKPKPTPAGYETLPLFGEDTA